MSITRGGGTGWGALGARAPPPLLGPKILKIALFYPEFPMEKVQQAPVPPSPTFRRVSSAFANRHQNLMRLKDPFKLPTHAMCNTETRNPCEVSQHQKNTEPQVPGVKKI